MPATFNKVSELRDFVVCGDPKWREKMLHPVPVLPVIKDRKPYLIERAKGQRVLDIGCTGDISAEIRKVAKSYAGVDREKADYVIDLDENPELPEIEVDLVICSEVLEHLANPGRFLKVLQEKYGNGPDICVTVPNAGGYAVKADCEIVHREHVCWYSYTTLKTLLSRYGFEVKHAAWYNGVPHKAEGLIMVVT